MSVAVAPHVLQSAAPETSAPARARLWLWLALAFFLLALGILLATLGFVSAYVALEQTANRNRWYSRALLAFVSLGVAIDLLGGPILRNPPPDALRAIAQLPVLAADVAFQHTTRIYLT